MTGNHFHLKDGELHAEGIPLSRIAAEVGTPVYVYSRGALQDNADSLRRGLSVLPRVHLAYAVKANPNLAVVGVLAKCGYGADIVSGGEMRRALAGGMAAADIVFSGVGKTVAELGAALDAGVGQFNIEIEEEGTVLAALAEARGTRAQAVLRVNPDVDAGTHAKISTGKAENKFGVAISDAPAIYARLAGLPGLAMRGVASHIGSQIKDLGPIETGYRRIGTLVAELRAAGHVITHVDLGGGFGVAYRSDEAYPTPEEIGAMIARATDGWDVTLMFEPGRFIAGNAGLLLTEVIWVKPGVGHPWVILDAAMNDLARPALYDAYHGFSAVRPSGERFVANIAGPVCESGDTFAKGREIDAVVRGDLGVLHTAGAYGATMASTYNSRALVPEVLVDGDRYAVVADRIDPAKLIDAERVPDWL